MSVPGMSQRDFRTVVLELRSFGWRKKEIVDMIHRYTNARALWRELRRLREDREYRSAWRMHFRNDGPIPMDFRFLYKGTA